MKMIVYILMLVMVTACAKTWIEPVEPSNSRYRFSADFNDLFSAAISAGQQMNLTIDVIEKDSGVLKFNNAALNVQQLDRYCRYPVITSRTNAPWGNFERWNARSLKQGEGNVRGRIAISLHMRQIEKQVTLDMLVTIEGYNQKSAHTCNSLNNFETEFINRIRDSL